MAQRDSVFQIINDLHKRLHKLEAVKQVVGADIVQIARSSLGSATSGSVAAGGKVTFTSTLTPSGGILNLWDFFHSVYVDNDANDAYLYPSGASLSSGQKNIDKQWSLDWALSDDDIGKRIAKVTIINNDSVPHTYYLYTRWYGVKQDI